MVCKHAQLRSFTVCLQNQQWYNLDLNTEPDSDSQSLLLPRPRIGAFSFSFKKNAEGRKRGRFLNFNILFFYGKPSSPSKKGFFESQINTLLGRNRLLRSWESLSESESSPPLPPVYSEIKLLAIIRTQSKFRFGAAKRRSKRKISPAAQWRRCTNSIVECWRGFTRRDSPSSESVPAFHN